MSPQPRSGDSRTETLAAAASRLDNSVGDAFCGLTPAANRYRRFATDKDVGNDKGLHARLSDTVPPALMPPADALPNATPSLRGWRTDRDSWGILLADRQSDPTVAKFQLADGQVLCVRMIHQRRQR